jgi:hypothetical protein
LDFIKEHRIDENSNPIKTDNEAIKYALNEAGLWNFKAVKLTWK